MNHQLPFDRVFATRRTTPLHAPPALIAATWFALHRDSNQARVPGPAIFRLLGRRSAALLGKNKNSPRADPKRPNKPRGRVSVHRLLGHRPGIHPHESSSASAPPGLPSAPYDTMSGPGPCVPE
jgi:hypothetical protein